MERRRTKTIMPRSLKKMRLMTLWHCLKHWRRPTKKQKAPKGRDHAPKVLIEITNQEKMTEAEVMNADDDLGVEVVIGADVVIVEKGEEVAVENETENEIVTDTVQKDGDEAEVGSIVTGLEIEEEVAEKGVLNESTINLKIYPKLQLWAQY